MSHAMISAIALLAGTVLHLILSLVEAAPGGEEATRGFGVAGWLRPMGWAALVCGAIFAVLAAR